MANITPARGEVRNRIPTNDARGAAARECQRAEFALRHFRIAMSCADNSGCADVDLARRSRGSLMKRRQTSCGSQPYGSVSRARMPCEGARVGAGLAVLLW